MAKISDIKIDAEVVTRILYFLNKVTTPEELAADFPNHPNEIGITVAKRILSRRKELGKYSKLQELDGIRGLGVDKFNDLVQAFTSEEYNSYSEINTVEPLFRFTSLRYHELPQQVATRKQLEKNSDKTSTHHNLPELSVQESKQLKTVHSTILAKHKISFLKALEEQLDNESKAYFKKREATFSAHQEEYIAEVKASLKQLDATQKKHLRIEQQLDDKTTLDQTILQQAEAAEGLYPAFKFEYPQFTTTEYLEKVLAQESYSFLDNHNLIDKDLVEIKKVLTQLIKDEQLTVSNERLNWKRNAAIKGHPITIKYNYNKAYALSIEAQTKTAFLSIVLADKNISAIKTQLDINGKTLLFDQSELIYANEDLFTFKIVLGDLPKLSSYQQFSIKATLEFEKKNTIEIDEFLSIKTPISINRYQQASEELRSMKTQGSGDNHSGLIRLGWADLMRVEQKLCCYIPGAIAHIENIMSREYKEKSTEYLERSENTIVVENETETVEKNDTTSVEKHDWNKEVKQTIQKDFKFNLGTNITYDTGVWYVGLNAGMSFANYRNQSNSNSQNFSKSITETASESIRTRSLEKKTSTLIKEFKEQNKHGFDNREGEKHVSGVYRWLDKTYKNQIVNYGKGMVYEFMIPKPAELYLKTLNPDEEPDNVLVKPEAPKIKSWQEITRDNYTQYINQYGVTDFQAPLDEEKFDKFEVGRLDHTYIFPATIKVEQTLKFTFRSDIGPFYFLEEVIGTSDYSIKGHNPIPVDPNGIFQVHLKNSSSQVKIAERGLWWLMANHPVSGNIQKSNLNFENEVDVHVFGNRVSVVDHVKLNFRFRLKASVFQQWQQDTYNSIIDAYNERLKEYNEALAAQNDDSLLNNDTQDQDNYKNPGFYSNIIDTELRRLSIELLLQNVNIDRCKHFYTMNQCNDSETCEEIPMLSSLGELDTRASLVKFLEQCFLWPVLSYNLYPYYWAGQCDWADMLHNEDTPDNNFQQFLKSGMARVIVPVREGFEKAVAYFLCTGQPWFGEQDPQIDDPMYVSIVEELKQPLGKKVGEPWETTVPSTLTLLQGESVYLKGEGLPCCDDNKGTTGIIGTDYKLEGKTEESTKE